MLRMFARFNCRRGHLLVIISLCGLGFALRLHRLDFHALWWDEGITLYFAPLDPVAMARAAALSEDVNPPAYRMALGVWMQVAGPSPFSIRYASLICGVLVVPLAWAVGKRTVGPGAAVIGAALTATGPALTYYSQEAKGYAFVALAVWLAHYLWLRLVSGQQRRYSRRWLWLTAYGAATTAALAAHYIASFNAAADGLWALASVRRHRERARLLILWALALVIALSVVLSYARLILRETAVGLEHTSESYVARSLFAYVSEMAGGLSGGPTAPQMGILTAAGLSALGLAAVLSSRRAHRQQSLVLAWLLVPLALGFVLQRVYAFFFARFLTYTAPALYLLAGAGLIRLHRRAPAVGALVALALLGLNVTSLNSVYTRPDDPGEDYRPLAAYMKPLIRPGDVVLHSFTWQAGYLASYLPGNRLDFELGYYTPDSVGQRLSSLVLGHTRIWQLEYERHLDDPANLAAAWLKSHLLRADLRTFGKTELALYIRPDATSPPLSAQRPEQRLSSLFGPAIVLDYTPLIATVRPGDVLGVSLTWRALATSGRRYGAFVHVRSLDGQLALQSDADPAGGERPTDLWQPGEVIADPRALLIGADLPPGSYEVFAGLYDRDTGARQPAQDAAGRPLGDSVLLGSIQVKAP